MPCQANREGLFMTSSRTDLIKACNGGIIKILGALFIVLFLLTFTPVDATASMNDEQNPEINCIFIFLLF